jgi:hypothetical protein
VKDEWTSVTGDVYAIIAISPEALTIEEWSSYASGCGNSRRALPKNRQESPALQGGVLKPKQCTKAFPSEATSMVRFNQS